MAVHGVSVAGLNTIVLPATSAGAIFQHGIAIGKFHGVITATGPSGALTVYTNVRGISDGIVCPPMRRPSPAMNSTMFVALSTSPRASPNVLPSSHARIAASSSVCLARSAAQRTSRLPRTGAGVSRHAGNACAAAATAAFTSSGVEYGTWPSDTRVSAGERLGTPFVAADSTHWPAMKFL